MHRESEQAVQERIEATRERMGHTIERIGDRVNPDRVQRELKNRARDQVDEFKSNVKRKARSTMRGMEHGVSEKGRGIWAAIRENPIPAGMIGMGAAWLVANGSRSHDRYPADDAYRRYPGGFDEYGAAPTGYTDTGEELRQRTERGSGAYSTGYTGTAGSRSVGDMEEESGRMDQAKDRAADAVENVREKGEDAMHSARQKGSEMAHRAEEGMHHARDRARDWSREARYRARRAEHRIEDSVRENPMTAGAIAAALGFAAGMMIPETRKEHELMGRTRDRMLDRAQDTARQATRKAKDVARETASRTAEEAVDEVWSDTDENREDSVSEPTR